MCNTSRHRSDEPIDPDIVCFRVGRPGIDDLDALQLRIREELVHSGAFYVVKTRLRDRTYLRTTIINPRTTEDDLSALSGPATLIWFIGCVRRGRLRVAWPDRIADPGLW